MPQNINDFEKQVQQRQRFAFGENWAQFLAVVDDDRIKTAEESLKTMLCVSDLHGKTFLDIGSGSGLFSLAARRLGAKVHSFDFDLQSVACTTELKYRYYPDDDEWQIEQASTLDAAYMNSLNSFDIVYTWGVLHHTGAMWIGIELAIQRVTKGGQLFIAIYNDQGWKSHFWWFVKRIYNKLPCSMSHAYGYAIGTLAELANIIKYTIKLQPMTAIRPLLEYKKRRGMSRMRDMIDWIGGFPFEFASYEVLSDYFSARGFQLCKGKEASSLGCNELVLRLPE